MAPGRTKFLEGDVMDQRTRAARPAPRTCRPRFERLEQRLALAVAAAGLDLDASLGSPITLDASASTGLGQLTYYWTQVAGPDVTGGTGKLSGIAPSFIAPFRVTSLQFELIVVDADGPSFPDRVAVSTFEDPLGALFVSPTGSDDNPGTRAAPFLTLPAAIAKAAPTGADLYLAGGDYLGVTELASGVSIYGGYDPQTWARDQLNQQTRIAGSAQPLRGIDVIGLTIDGLTIESEPATAPGASSEAIVLTAALGVALQNNIIIAGAGAAGAAGESAQPGQNGGSSIGINLLDSSIQLFDNQIATSNGGNGGAGATGATGGRGGNSLGINATSSEVTSANNLISIGAAGSGGTGGLALPGLAREALGAPSGFSPIYISLAVAPVYENQPAGTLAGTLGIFGATSSESFTFSLASGPGDDHNTSFSITGDQLLVAHPLDFESRPIARIRIRATDGRGQSVERPLSLIILNNNDPPVCNIAPLGDTTDEAPLQIVENFVSGCYAGSPADLLQQLEVTLQTGNTSLFSTPPTLDASGTLIFDPAPNVSGVATLTITVSDGGGTANGGVDTVTAFINLTVAKPRPWQNALQPLDVLADGTIAGRDVLEIINELNAFGPRPLPPRSIYEPPYYDVTGDNTLTAADALRIINAMNAGLPAIPDPPPDDPPPDEPPPDEPPPDLLTLLPADTALINPRPKRAKP